MPRHTPPLSTLQALHVAAHPDGQLKAEAGKQGRGKRNVDFLLEFCGISNIAFSVQQAEQMPIGFRLDTGMQLASTFIPKGSKVLRIALTEKGENGSDHLAFIGNAWKPEAFLKARLDKEHPIDCHGALDPEYYQLLFDILTRSKAATINIRNAKLLEANKLVSKFKESEKKLHEAIDPLRQQTLQGKNFSVFKELCRAVGLK